MERKNKNLIVKDNALNSYTFYKSAVQLKVFWKLIIEISKDPSKQIYRVPIFHLLKEINFKNKWNSELKNIVRKMGQMVEIPKEKGFKFSALFYNIETEDSTYLDFEVNPSLKPYLLSLNDNFTKYHFENITILKSFYSIRIYELLKQFESSWKWFISIDKLRETLKIEQKQYKLYWDFKRKVLKVAQRELEEKTDIKFIFEEHKVVRKIVRLTFTILPNNKPSNWEKIPTKTVPKELPKITKNKSYKILSEHLKIDENFIKEIYQNYDEKIILENAKHTLKEFEKGTIKSSIGGFLREALKHNFANQKSLLTLQKEQEEAKVKKQQLEAEKEAKAKAKREELQKLFHQNIETKTKKFMAENQDKMPKYYEKFKEKYTFVLAGEEDILKAIQKPTVHNFFINFLSKKVLDKEELDFEKFQKNQKDFII